MEGQSCPKLLERKEKKKKMSLFLPSKVRHTNSEKKKKSGSLLYMEDQTHLTLGKRSTSVALWGKKEK